MHQVSDTFKYLLAQRFGLITFGAIGIIPES